MFGRKNEKQESLPWYREPNYKGDLTEDEKRELDSLRYRADRQGVKHPAATYDDLPDEVQSYISRLQIELYDNIQANSFGRSFGERTRGVFAFQLFRVVFEIQFDGNASLGRTTSARSVGL